MVIPLSRTASAQTYRALVHAHRRLQRVLADEMLAETGLTLERYEILLRLSQGGLRPTELAEGLPITRSGTSRLIARLEDDGLVRRVPCDDDGRGTLITLSERGDEVFRRAGRVHLRGLQAHLGDAFSTEQLQTLRELLEVLAELGATDDDER